MVYPERLASEVSLTVHEPVTATFALRYLVNFSKAPVIKDGLKGLAKNGS